MRQPSADALSCTYGLAANVTAITTSKRLDSMSSAPPDTHRLASDAHRFQLVVQVGTFASLFLMMFETYPFRVGLMGMLTSQYLTVYIINILYFITTTFVYGYRVVRGVVKKRGSIADDTSVRLQRSRPVSCLTNHRNNLRGMHADGEGQEIPGPRTF